MPIEDIPFYIFDLADFNGGIGDIDNDCRFCFELQPIKIEKKCLDRHCLLKGDRCL